MVIPRSDKNIYNSLGTKFKNKKKFVSWKLSIFVLVNYNHLKKQTRDCFWKLLYLKEKKKHK